MPTEGNGHENDGRNEKHRTILHEVTGLSGRLLMFFTWGTALGLSVLGMRAILAVTFLTRGVS